MTTRLFLLVLCLAAAYAQEPGQDAAVHITAGEFIARIQKQTGVPVPPNTVDTIKAGTSYTPVTGIATTMMATLDVLQRAAAAGKNLVITHEPTFYSHLDQTEPLAGDPVYAAKQAFIEQHHMVVFRFHDMWHQRKPDGIQAGMVAALGWQRYQNPDNPRLYTFPPTTLAAFAASIKAKLHDRTMRVVGDPNLKFTKVALAPGAAGSPMQMKAIGRDDVEVLVIGETREWETVPYVQDAMSEGKHKALIILGHVASEEAGMEECARWLRTFITEVPVEFIPAREPFWAPK